MTGKESKLDPSHPLHVFKIHRILAHSYSVYFLLFLVGVVLDIAFDVHIFSDGFWVTLGLALIILSTMLIIWAQHTSRTVSRANATKETFCKGPYCYTRSPTHWGLFLLMLGFGLVGNAFFVVLFTIIAFLLTRFTFLRKEEEALKEKYGEPYVEYHKSVKL